jgi:hypothetical protein
VNHFGDESHRNPPPPSPYSDGAIGGWTLDPADKQEFWAQAEEARAARKALSPLDDEMPWRIVVDGRVFAVDLLRTVPTDRLLERVDRAPPAAVLAVRRALRTIT